MTTPPFGATLDRVQVRYARRRDPAGADALADATCVIRPGVVTGLAGRNGAGKTTLLQVLAGYVRPTSGRVTVGPEGQQEDPWENPWTASATQIVRESGDVPDIERVGSIVDYWARMRPEWDADLALSLLDRFEVDTRKKPAELSRGRRSALGATIGLASRAPLTIFDESTLGMDAPARETFYDELVADYTRHPRTVVLSSHYIAEVERVVEDFVVVHRGRVLLAEPADAVRERGHCLTGPAGAVEPLVAGRRVLHRQQLGPTVSITVEGPPDEAAAVAADVTVGAVPLQDLFVRLTQDPVDHGGAR